MNKNTQVLLGVAVLAGVGYYLYTQNKKKSFASFMEDDFSDPVTMTEKCKGDYGKDAEGRYICCRSKFRSYQTSGLPCEGGAQKELAF